MLSEQFVFFFLMKQSWFNEYGLFREFAIILKIVNGLMFMSSHMTFVKELGALKSND